MMPAPAGFACRWSWSARTSGRPRGRAGWRGCGGCGLRRRLQAVEPSRSRTGGDRAVERAVVDAGHSDPVAVDVAGHLPDAVHGGDTGNLGDLVADRLLNGRSRGDQQLGAADRVGRLWLTEAFADAAMTTRPLIRASEIIRADAVAEVRRGLRSALRRPRVTGALRPNGEMSPRTAYRLIRGRVMITPSSDEAGGQAEQERCRQALQGERDRDQDRGHQQQEAADQQADEQRAFGDADVVAHRRDRRRACRPGARPGRPRRG